jgi:hypothetical protein
MILSIIISILLALGIFYGFITLKKMHKKQILFLLKVLGYGTICFSLALFIIIFIVILF